MNGSSVLLDRIGGRCAALRLVDGRIEDLLVDPAEGLLPGAILRGVVDRPVKGQGGVFLRLPGGGSGFLRQVGGLAPGQSLLVQVTGYPEPGKAVPLTAKVLFKSKYAIVTPGAPGENLSRQIRDADLRAALIDLARAQPLPGDTGLILRSDAATAEPAEITADVARTAALALQIMAESAGPPELLLEGPDAHAVAWRDWGHPEEVVDSPGCLAARSLLDEIAAALRPEWPLAGGGSLVVEPTRALVAVDVNTGPDTSPAAALKANIAAARALPRALRLRGLGGQVVVDFAPLAKKDRATLEQVLRAAFRADPVETALAGWTPLGHFELQRKRERLPLEAHLLEES